MTPGCPTSREIWLIVAQGGWWKTAEIKAHLDPEMDLSHVHNRLWVLTNRQRCLVTRGTGENREYAVSPDCVAPYGLTVRQITGAVVGI
jgi:hypothetical protein